MIFSTKNNLTLLLTLTLTACGGGSGGSGSTSTTPTTTQPTVSTMDEQFGLYLTDLSNNLILPGYQLLADNAEQFVSKTEAFCDLTDPTQGELNLLRLGWWEVNLQWQTVQWLKLGAVVKNNHLLRLQYWPDDQNSVARGVDDLLNASQFVDAQYVGDHNVGGQGIPAAERLLYPSINSNNLLNASNKTKRCEVLHAIATNMATISHDIYQAWQPEGGNYVNQLINGTGDFSGRKDSVEELVGNWLEQLERVKDEKMLIPLSDHAPGVVQLSEFYFSDASVTAIKINLAVFQEIYTAGGGYGFDDILVSHLQQNTIETAMDEGLSTVINKATAMQGTLSELLAQESDRAQIKSLITAIQDFRSVFTADFVQALDIYIGFNSSDGD